MANWIRLNKEQAFSVLDRLSHHRDAVVFSKEATEVAYRELPFYSRYKIYRLTNYATMPSFSMQYLSDGEEFIQLDGTANPIYTVNEKDPVKLNEMSVIPYLDFFFANVQGSEGDIFFVKDPKRMPFMSSLSAAQQKSIIDSHKPLEVAADVLPGNFRVTGTLYYDGGLISATILMSTDGKLSFQNQALLLQGIHFPHSVSAGEWLESD